MRRNGECVRNNNVGRRRPRRAANNLRMLQITLAEENAGAVIVHLHGILNVCGSDQPPEPRLVRRLIDHVPYDLDEGTRRKVR